MTLSIIDIGSNSVRLMVWTDGKVLFKKVSTTRLGEGLASASRLSPQAMERTVEAVSDFFDRSRDLHAAVYAFATAAVRTAENRDDFLRLVKSRTGLDVDVVSGDEEALLGLLGALGGKDGTVIDLGGASTEVCIREGGKLRFSVSLPMGAVKLFDRCGSDAELLYPAVRDVVRPLEGVIPVSPVYAIGGTASTLAQMRAALPSYDGAALQNTALSATWLREEGALLLNMTVEERKRIVGMDERRADVIAGSTLLLSAAVDRLKLPFVLFSDRDNLEGYLYYRGLV